MDALITIEEAEALIRANTPVLGEETVTLQSAHGRLLRRPILSDRPSPPFDRAMMDGIALHSSALTENREFPIEQIQAAGESQKKLESTLHCLEVMTGAVLPQGADCVIKIEDIQIEDNIAKLLPHANAVAGQHVHPMGSDCKTDETVLSTGSLLGPAELAIAASYGATELTVSRIPSILLITTGDEVIDPADTPLPHQIRRSHPTAIIGAIASRQLGNVTHNHLPDNREALDASLKENMTKYDVVLITGGISMGKFDYVAPVLKDLIGDPVFHGIRQRPGKPFAFWSGTAPEKEGVKVFCLPGNPVSVMACLARYILPALRQMRNESWQPQQLPLVKHFEWHAKFPGLLASKVIDGKLLLSPPKNSGDYTALAGCTGVTQDPQELSKTVSFYPW